MVENREGSMDLADLLKPREKVGRVGVDPQHLGALVSDGDLDQLVELLVDAALQQFDQLLPGDIGPAAAAELLDLGQLIQGVLVFVPDGAEAVDLGRLGLALVALDDAELFLGEVLERRKIRFDDLVQIGCPQRPVGQAGQKRVGPGLEQLLAVAGELELPLELLVGDARPREVAVRLGHPPIGQGRRRKGHSEQQTGRDH